MSNFFSSGAGINNNGNFFDGNPPKTGASPLSSQYDNLKNNYEQIFIEAAESIRREVNKFKPESPCENCPVKDCKIEIKDVFTPFPANCAYREWQLKILTFLAGDYRQTLKMIHKNILEKKCDYSCARCAACCKLATSELSYAQLKQRAMRGDKFSADFVSVFVPYETEEEAKNANPEYFELIDNLLEDEKVYYYYCPKLDGNTCTIYKNRPDICKVFPHNPLKLLPSTCSFNGWKDEVAHQSMLLKAKVDIIEFYKEKLG